MTLEFYGRNSIVVYEDRVKFKADRICNLDYDKSGSIYLFLGLYYDGVYNQVGRYKLSYTLSGNTYSKNVEVDIPYVVKEPGRYCCRITLDESYVDGLYVQDEVEFDYVFFGKAISIQNPKISFGKPSVIWFSDEVSNKEDKKIWSFSNFQGWNDSLKVSRIINNKYSLSGTIKYDIVLKNRHGATVIYSKTRDQLKQGYYYKVDEGIQFKVIHNAVGDLYIRALHYSDGGFYIADEVLVGRDFYTGPGVVINGLSYTSSSDAKNYGVLKIKKIFNFRLEELPAFTIELILESVSSRGEIKEIVWASKLYKPLKSDHYYKDSEIRVSNRDFFSLSGERYKISLVYFRLTVYGSPTDRNFYMGTFNDSKFMDLIRADALKMLGLDFIE